MKDAKKPAIIEINGDEFRAVVFRRSNTTDNGKPLFYACPAEDIINLEEGSPHFVIGYMSHNGASELYRRDL